MDPIRILLVDDQVLFRKGVRALLEEQADMVVVGEGSNGLEAVELVQSLLPDIVLMDINMPHCDGVEATRLIKGDRPETKIVILTVSDEDEELFAAIKGGAEGYLLKDLRPEELVDLLHGVMKGETPISAAVAGKLLREFRTRPWHDTGQPGDRSLTSRELEVLQLVTEGLSNAEIAARLYIVEGTVKNHLHNILEKLHLENRLQAATYAIREGLVERPRKQPRP
jgi:DNA-binding NarL/FixJ family response regulator